MNSYLAPQYTKMIPVVIKELIVIDHDIHDIIAPLTYSMMQIKKPQHGQHASRINDIDDFTKLCSVQNYVLRHIFIL